MRGVVLLAALAAVILMAGCLKGPAEADVASAPPDDPGSDRTARQGRGGRDRDRDDEPKRSGNVTLRHFEDSFAVTLTSVLALIDIGTLDGYNCVDVMGAPFTITKGTATATWSPTSELSKSLDLVVYAPDDRGNGYDKRESGASPLVAEFKDVEVSDEGYYDYATIGLHLSGPVSAAYEQKATLDIAFDYESDADVDVGPGYC